MKHFETIKCDACGHRFTPGNTNGLPNGVGFQGKDGKVITLCQKCLLEVGALKSDSERDAFFARLGK